MSNKLFQMERPDFGREPPEIQEPILSDVINYQKVRVGYLWVPLHIVEIFQAVRQVGKLRLTGDEYLQAGDRTC